MVGPLIVDPQRGTGRAGLTCGGAAHVDPQRGTGRAELEGLQNWRVQARRGARGVVP